MTSVKLKLRSHAALILTPARRYRLRNDGSPSLLFFLCCFGTVSAAVSIDHAGKKLLYLARCVPTVAMRGFGASIAYRPTY